MRMRMDAWRRRDHNAATMHTRSDTPAPGGGIGLQAPGRHAARGLAWAAALLLSLLAQAHASTLIRDYTPRYSTTARGEVLVVGNTLMTCTELLVGSCVAARNATATGADNNNNNHFMEWINQDGVTTVPQNSSSATLTLPAGSTVLYAALYWGADTSAGGTIAGVAGLAAPSAAARNVVQFATPASGYAATTALQTDASGTRYSSVANVTSRVQAGGSGTYRVSGLQAGRGGDRYGGWALVVVVGNPSLPPRNMVLFDGYATINATAPTSITTTVSGFRTAPTGVRNTSIGFVAYEGDLNNSGDQFILDSTPLGDALSPTNNVFNSTITANGVRFGAKSPDYVNQLGFDADLLSANNVLPNNATSANLTFTTAPANGETYFPAALVFSTQVFEPVVTSNLTKSVSDLNGGTVAPGDVLEYTVNYGNTGNDGALQTVLTDAIPANTTYVAGSLELLAGPNAGPKTDAAGDDQAEFDTANNRVVFRLGTGANATTGGNLAAGVSGSLRFRVQVNAATAQGTSIPNVARIAFVSESLGEPVNGNSNTVTVVVSNQADLSITKTNNATTVVAGRPTTYVITVNNAGPAAANGASVRDAATVGLDCLNPPATGTATCEGTNGALCPGGGAAGSIPVATLQSPGGAVIPTLPAGGQVRIELTCAATP